MSALDRQHPTRVVLDTSRLTAGQLRELAEEYLAVGNAMMAAERASFRQCEFLGNLVDQLRYCAAWREMDAEFGPTGDG